MELNANKKQLVTTILVIVILLLPSLMYAQVVDPGDDPDAVPLDGGVSVLIISAIGYGIKKIKEKTSGKTSI